MVVADVDYVVTNLLILQKQRHQLIEMLLHHLQGLKVVSSLESPVMLYKLFKYHFESHCVAFFDELVQDALEIQIRVINDG